MGKDLGGSFFRIAIGYVVLAGLRLKRANDGRLSFTNAFKYTYLLFMSFWTFDLVILDWLLLTTIQPKFVILPGTEGKAGYRDYRFHLRVSWPAVPVLVVPSAIIAWLVSRRRDRMMVFYKFRFLKFVGLWVVGKYFF